MELVEQSDSDTTVSEPEHKAPNEPAPEEVQAYIAEETGLTAEQIADEAAAYQDRFQIVGDLAAYYLVGQDHGVNPANAFDTQDQDLELDIANIYPQMQVTTEATVASVELVDPDGKDWTRQDIQLTDDSGTVTFVLWNDDVRDDLAEGDDVELVDCWAKEYNGDVQVTLGKSGRINRMKASS